MLEKLIAKYKNNDIQEVVYRLSYAGKFIIVKGNTLAGSLIIINNTYSQYGKDKKRFKKHLYGRLYSHVVSNPTGKFTVKVLTYRLPVVSQFDLLRREQMELDKNQGNPLCLNNRWDAYVPNYNKDTDKYGWISKDAVMQLRRYLNSKERLSYIKRYNVYLGELAK